MKRRSLRRRLLVPPVASSDGCCRTLINYVIANLMFSVSDCNISRNSPAKRIDLKDICPKYRFVRFLSKSSLMWNGSDENDPQLGAWPLTDVDERDH